MPEVGCGWLCRSLCFDETVRGQSYSRRHSQTSVQNTPDQARHARFIDIRSNAVGLGVAARAEIGLIRLRQGYGGRRRSSAHVKSAVHVEHVSGDITCQWRRQEQRRIDNLVSFA